MNNGHYQVASDMWPVVAGAQRSEQLRCGEVVTMTEVVFSGEPAVSAVQIKLLAIMQGENRMRLSIADLQNRLMMSSLDIGVSSENTSHLVRDVGFR